MYLEEAGVKCEEYDPNILCAGLQFSKLVKYFI